MDCHVDCVFSRAFRDDPRITACAVVVHDIIHFVTRSLCAFINDADPRISAVWARHCRDLGWVDRRRSGVAFGKQFGAFFARINTEARKRKSRGDSNDEGEASNCFHNPFCFCFPFSIGQLAHIHQTPWPCLLRKIFEQKFLRVFAVVGVSTM